MIYLLIGIYLLFLSYYYDFKGHCRRKWFHYGVILLTLILVAGLRYHIGLDSQRYEARFQTLPKLNQLSIEEFSESAYDPLYLLMASFCRTISDEFWVLQLAQAILVNVVFLRFFRKNTKNVFVAILLYYVILYISNMAETMRESCAISMILLGWEYLKSNHKFGFVIFCLFAFLFHSSAIIAIAVCLLVLAGIHEKIRFSFGTVFGALLIFVMSTVVQNVFSDALTLLAFSSRLSDKIDIYSDTAMFSNTLNLFGIISVSLLYGFVPYICAKTLRGTKYSNTLEFFLVIEMFCAAFSFPISIFYRYINYFMPFVILAMAKALSEKSYRIPFIGTLKTSIFTTWLLLSLPFIIERAKYMFGNDGDSKYKVYSRYYPYSSILTEDLDPDRENK